MAYATVADVQSRLGRPLTPDEEQMTLALLDDVEAMIRARVTDLDARVDADPNYEKLVVMVEVNAVLRVLRNPDAFIAETDGNYSYQRAQNGASGYLDILPNEWDWLSGGGGMFQIIPVDPFGSSAEGATTNKGLPDHYLPCPSFSFRVRVR